MSLRWLSIVIFPDPFGFTSLQKNLGHHGLWINLNQPFLKMVIPWIIFLNVGSIIGRVYFPVRIAWQ
jgi:hypothetical protein